MADAPTEVIPAVQPGDPEDSAAPDAAAAAPEEAPETPEDLSAQASDLEEQLAVIRGKAAQFGGTVRLKVEEPFAAFALGHIVIGNDFTDVPANSVAAVMEGAANSGVTITQEEG